MRGRRRRATRSFMRERKSILIDITHPELESGLIRGFRFFWAFYVSGFRPERHCQPCFKGRRVPELSTGTARSGRQVALDLMDRCKYVYICGVGNGPKNELFKKNLHLPLGYEEGAVVEASTYNGYVVTARNAAVLPIPELPDGWNGRDRETTRCKNFRFGVAHFGEALPRHG